MPLYQFTALDERGRTVRGRLEAADEEALGAALRIQGQWLASAAPNAALRKPARRMPAHRSVPRRVLIQFFLSFSLQLKAGVTAFNALAFGIEKNSHAGFRAVHADLLERVRAGTSLSEAMSVHPRTFSSVVVNLVRAGEASGHLAEVCEEIRRHYEWTDRIATDVRQALMYPVTVLVAVTVFFFVVFTFFIPRFTGVLMELGVVLPALTRFMIGLSEFMKASWGTILGTIAVGTGLAIWVVRRFPTAARAVDRAKLGVPLFGPIIAQICLSRFVQNLAVLYRAGIPLLEALRLCQPLVGNRAIEHQVARLRDGVSEGHSLHDTMALGDTFPPLVVQMTALGESTGTLDSALQNVADYYNVVIPREVKKVFGLFEPIMILGLIGLVGTVALSVFLPIASALEGR